MKIRLFDKLNKRKNILDLEKKAVALYLCGPTVYDHVHVGNLRSVFFFDFLSRLFIIRKIKVNYIQNITDIDDKIINRSSELKKKETELANYYTNQYFEVLKKYQITYPKKFLLVTEKIPQIINFIENLIKKDFAYAKERDVYFKLEGTEKYGHLSKQKKENLLFDKKKNKNDLLDFVLWKSKNVGLNWDSPWGRGRPGWHTECVTLIDEYFAGETIDIHGGGSDLIFPHHENERAQYLAKNSREISKFWIHVSHVTFEKEKMSKSRGNVIYAKDFFDKHGSDLLKYIFFSSHFSKQIDLNKELIKQFSLSLNKIKNTVKRARFFSYFSLEEKKSPENWKTFNKKKKKIFEILEDNFRTNKVLYILETSLKKINKKIDQRNFNNIFLNELKLVYFISDLIGINLIKSTYTEAEKKIIDRWKKCLEIKKYSQADELRKTLQEKDLI